MIMEENNVDRERIKTLARALGNAGRPAIDELRGMIANLTSILSAIPETYLLEDWAEKLCIAGNQFDALYQRLDTM